MRFCRSRSCTSESVSQPKCAVRASEQPKETNRAKESTHATMNTARASVRGNIVQCLQLGLTVPKRGSSVVLSLLCRLPSHKTFHSHGRLCFVRLFSAAPADLSKRQMTLGKIVGSNDEKAQSSHSLGVDTPLGFLVSSSGEGERGPPPSAGVASISLRGLWSLAV